MNPSDIHWSTIGAFLASIAAVIIAVSATVINYLFFRSEIDPNVIIYTTHDERRPTIILLIIENIGKSIAKNVKFSFSKSLPQDAFGFEDAAMPKTLNKGPLFNGIPALGPGSKRIIMWGQYGGIYKAIGDKTINVTVRFSSDRILPFFPTNHEVICPIDIKSFEYTDVSDNNWDKKSAEQLKRIADTIDKISRAT